MPVNITQANLVPTNSTTYVDLVGILLGLNRQIGENSSQFLDRIRQAAPLDRSAKYAGLQNEIMLQLGLVPSLAIRVQSIYGNQSSFVLTVDIGGVSVTMGAITAKYPLLTIDVDYFWSWRKLSDITADLNTFPGLSATLLSPDGPALVLAKQSNTLLAVAEAIDGKDVLLGHSTLVPQSETFNQRVPTYTYSGTSTLIFAQNLAPGTAITYQYQNTVYSIVASPVLLFSLLDPALAAVAVTSDERTLVYQVAEYLQEVMGRDLSYWAN